MLDITKPAVRRDPITASVKDFCGMSGLCRDKVFEMIKSGELESVKIGKLRLIIIDSYRNLLSRQARI